MTDDPRKRSDFSRFLVHLTRKTKGVDAEDNLINILKDKKIEARNFHCLFGPKLKKMKLTDLLLKKFKTVCFTETPLDQIHKMVSETYPRRIKLKAYGLVFWRDELVDEGANPALYINSKGTTLRDYLLSEFDSHFKGVNAFQNLRAREAYYREIVHYYSIINVISEKYDFSWEREWRHSGHFKFKYVDVVAIVAKNPEKFENKCENEFKPKQLKKVRRIPVISPYWSYEEVIEELSIKIWQKRA
jgi:hypothetical protein